MSGITVRARFPGFAALQLYKGKRRHIQTVISDSGLGIATTLKRNLKNIILKFSRNWSHQAKMLIYSWLPMRLKMVG